MEKLFSDVSGKLSELPLSVSERPLPVRVCYFTSKLFLQVSLNSKVLQWAFPSAYHFAQSLL